MSPVDLFLSLGVLSETSHQDWRKGRIPYLERVCRGSLPLLNTIMRELRSFAAAEKLKASFTVYNKWGKGPKRRLRFSKSGEQPIEAAYSTHCIRNKEKLLAQPKKDSLDLP